VAIIKHFEKLGVPRDLGAKIRAKAESLVAAAAVTGKVSPETKQRDSAIVEAGGLAAATVVLTQRADIRRARILTMNLLAELEAQTGNLPGLIELGDVLRNPSESGADRLNDIYKAVIALPERTKTMKALAESLRGLVSLEREAFGMDEKKPTAAGGDITITF
jgi:hypothetical protein